MKITCPSTAIGTVETDIQDRKAGGGALAKRMEMTVVDNYS